MFCAPKVLVHLVPGASQRCAFRDRADYRDSINYPRLYLSGSYQNCLKFAPDLGSEFQDEGDPCFIRYPKSG